MSGEFIGVWSETLREIWLPLIESDDVPNDVFCELYRELAPALKTKTSVEDLADIIDDPVQARDAFEKIAADDFAGERALASFLEAAHPALDDLGGDGLSNRYYNLLAAFIDKFSLRYDLRRPCTLCPTLPGIFASLVRDLRGITNQDLHLDTLMKDFEDAVRDLRYGCTDGRIKTSIGKQFMLLEAIGASAPGVTKGTLGDMLDQLRTWPHAAIKDSLKKLYGFASDYPGIRHGSNAKGALRAIEMRDMVAMSILLIGFTPYLEGRLIPEEVFGGSAADREAVVRSSLSQSPAALTSAEPTVRRKSIKDLWRELLLRRPGA